MLAVAADHTQASAWTYDPSGQSCGSTSRCKFRSFQSLFRSWPLLCVTRCFLVLVMLIFCVGRACPLCLKAWHCPEQVALVLPFMRFGEVLLDAPQLPWSPVSLKDIIFNHPGVQRMLLLHHGSAEARCV